MAGDCRANSGTRAGGRVSTLSLIVPVAPALARGSTHLNLHHGHCFISLYVIDTRQGEKPRGLFVLSGEKSSAPRPSPIQRFSPNPNGVAIWVIGSGRQGLAPFERDKQAAR